MDVNDVKPRGANSDAIAAEVSSASANVSNQKKIENTAVQIDAVQIDTESGDRISAVRASANQVINVINVASDATNEIDKLVKSISGIVDQASRQDVPEKRLAVLQSEANQLVDAIKQQVTKASTPSGNPLTGDPIRLEVEKEIGKTLDVTLPEHAKDAFGIGTITFSRKEAIIDTRTSVERAQKQLDELKKAVQQSKSAVDSTVGALDVALQNSEASRASVRDLDQALKLAYNAKTKIENSPLKALGSFTTFSKKALDLLE